VSEQDPVICICRQVTEDQICAVIEAGATDLPAVRAACGANLECGGCADDIEELLADASQ
jgi:bacterioferritin-associated ferredoxin